MKKQINNLEKEIDFLKRQLSTEEIYLLGFLKGFDRKQLKKWVEKGLLGSDYYVNYQN